MKTYTSIHIQMHDFAINFYAKYICGYSGICIYLKCIMHIRILNILPIGKKVEIWNKSMSCRRNASICNSQLQLLTFAHMFSRDRHLEIMRIVKQTGGSTHFRFESSQRCPTLKIWTWTIPTVCKAQKKVDQNQMISVPRCPNKMPPVAVLGRKPRCWSHRGKFASVCDQVVEEIQKLMTISQPRCTADMFVAEMPSKSHEITMEYKNCSSFLVHSLFFPWWFLFHSLFFPLSFLVHSLFFPCSSLVLSLFFPCLFLCSSLVLSLFFPCSFLVSWESKGTPQCHPPPQEIGP